MQLQKIHLVNLYLIIDIGNPIQYDLISGKFCGRGNKCNTEEEPRYGNFSTLDEATAACDLDDTCNMVMDQHCDETGPFELCHSSNVCGSGQGTCSYQKPLGNLIIMTYNI